MSPRYAIGVDERDFTRYYGVRVMTRAPFGFAWLTLAVACGTNTAPPGTPSPVRTPPPALPVVDAAPEPASEPDAAVTTLPPAAELLKDGFEQRYRERALPLANRQDAPPRVVVAEEPGKARLIVDGASFRVLVWAEHAALGETPLAVTALTRQPAKAGAKEQVFVGPGAFLERKSEKNGFVRVSAHDRTFGVEGFLPASALGRVYVPAEVPDIDGGEAWAFSHDAKVLERPGGRALGKLLDTSAPQVAVVELSRGAGWFVEIAYRSPTLSVRGFVPKSALSPLEHVGWGRGYGSVHRNNPPEEKLTFASGACLYAEPWGEVVGVLRLPLTASVHIEAGERAAWREVELPWAGTKVWVPREGASTTPPAMDEKTESLSLADGFSCAAPPKR